ncbi:F-box only protein 8-like [Rutidosis leptorrhynchoides]|uniref:F-box only protein 8-like n=1 Tax=Rutidosis leptorrhynchoides TaxID=125765 RepID=UPI003A99CE5A
MANYIPLVIQIKILCRLPAKSLIRFRSVSKDWKSLIDSSNFNSDFIVHQARRKRLLLWSDYTHNDCIVDVDDSIPQQKISLSHPLSFNRFYCRLRKRKQMKFVGCSYGLLCYAGRYLSSEDDDYFNCYVIWNPTIRKSVVINALYNKRIYVGFGVCPNTLDPKIVRINIIHVSRDDVQYDDNKDKVWRVEVFTLRGRVWRSPLTKLPRKWLKIDLYRKGTGYKTPLVINGFIYWCAYSNSTNMVVFFDLGSEEFAKVQVPSYLYNTFDIFKLRNSLGVVGIDREEVHNVCLLDHVSKSFIKLYTFTLPKMWSWSKILGFRDDEQLIIIKRDNDAHGSEFVAYDPNLKHFNGLKNDVSCFTFTSYSESLLLLDQSGTLDDDDDDEGDVAHTTRFLDHQR